MWRLVAALAFGSWIAVGGGQGEAKPPAGDASVSRETAKLLAEFRRARGDADEQAEVVEKVIAAGPGTVNALQKQIFRELHPQLDHYRLRFQQQAAGLAKNRLRDADLSEISRLREPVLALAKGKPTHEELVATGDPAMARLMEIFVVRPADVLARSKDLQAERQRLQALGKLWERCLAALDQGEPAEGESQQRFSFEEYLTGEEEARGGPRHAHGSQDPAGSGRERPAGHPARPGGDAGGTGLESHAEPAGAAGTGDRPEAGSRRERP